MKILSPISINFLGRICGSAKFPNISNLTTIESILEILFTFVVVFEVDVGLFLVSNEKFHTLGPAMFTCIVQQTATIVVNGIDFLRDFTMRREKRKVPFLANLVEVFRFQGLPSIILKTEKRKSRR